MPRDVVAPGVVVMPDASSSLALADKAEVQKLGGAKCIDSIRRLGTVEEQTSLIWMAAHQAASPKINGRRPSADFAEVFRENMGTVISLSDTTAAAAATALYSHRSYFDLLLLLAAATPTLTSASSTSSSSSAAWSCAL